MRRVLVMIAVLWAVPAAAQLEYRPASPPFVTADNDLWYVRGDPVPFAGELYYPTGGSKVLFNGTIMVRSGDYQGVPLYVDVTLEPYSMVLVPIGGGLMHQYELPRHGAPPPTSESGTPSDELWFPVAEAVADQTPSAVHLPNTVRRSLSNDGGWLRFGGERWVSAGAAVPFAASEFILVGQHAGFPAFARRALKEDVVYLPARPGVVAPVRLKN